MTGALGRVGFRGGQCVLRGGLGAHRGELCLPVRADALEHARAGDLVDAHQQRLAGFPARGAVLDEVLGNLLQPLVGGDDLVVLAQQLLQQGRLIRVEVSLLDLVGDQVVEVEPRHAELLAAVLIHQLDRGAVFFRTLEVVARHVVAEDALGHLVVGEQRRAGETDEGGVGQRDAHVAGETPGLGSVCLVGHDDDVVALAVGLVRFDVLVEFVDQAEDVGVILLQHRLQVRPGLCPRRLVADDAAADKSLVDLAIKIVAVGHQQEGETARQGAPHFLGEESHRVRLAATLGVPEHAEATEVGVRPLDDVDWPLGDVAATGIGGAHPVGGVWRLALRGALLQR